MSNSEHLVAIVSFDGAIKREVKRLRERLKSTDAIHSFHLKITASGRVHDGDVELAYNLSDNEYTEAVKGHTLDPVVDEYLRRHGWTAVNAPKAIGYERIPSDNTNEISF